MTPAAFRRAEAIGVEKIPERVWLQSLFFEQELENIRFGGKRLERAELRAGQRSGR
jgi:hypothetical protein